MNYEEKYKKLVDAIKEMRDVNPSDEGLQNWINDNVPELAESDDERIRRALITYFYGFPYNCLENAGTNPKEAIAWLEKQESVDRDRLAKGVLKGVANSIMQWIDANVTECNMCLSNMEREDIENAIVNLDWDKVYRYMKKIDKQGETPKGKTALEAWKNMRLEVYQQASGNRHEHNYSDDTTKMFSLNDIDEIFEKIAEKHEENSTVKVEQKFHEGDWIVLQDKCYKVNYNGCGYELVDQNGLSTSLEYGTIDENAHLWTIADAKPGDVLYYKSDNNIEYIVMNKGINMHGNIDSYFRYNSLDGFAVDVPAVLSAENDNITLATKEQRDLLFSKMRESGYEWDAENKVLKKISISMNKEDLIKRVDEIDHILFGLNANEALIVLAATTTLVIETMVSSDKHSEVTKTLETMFNEIKKQN